MRLRHVALSLSMLAVAGFVLAAYAQKTGAFRSSEFTEGKRGLDDAELIRARANWFYHQRAYPLARIPASARERAWDTMRQMRQAQSTYLQQKYGANYSRLAAAAAQAAGTVKTAANWVSIGPQPTNAFFFQPYVSGRVNALLVDPCDSTGNTVLLGGAQGGLWLTTNGGTNWTPQSDQAPSLAIGSIAVPPASAGCTGTSSNTVYVGTGEENFAYDSYYGAGVLKCTLASGKYACARPANQTFGTYVIGNQPLTQDTGGPYIGGLAVDPQNPQILLASVQGYQSVLQSGIWCSADSGSTWNHVLPGVTQVVGTGVAFDQAGYAYAALGNIAGSSANGVYKSSAALTTSCSPNFTQLGGLSSLASPTSTGRITISVASNPSSPTNQNADEIFAAIADASNTSSTLLGVFGSGDGGSTWTQLTNSLVSSGGGFCDNQCFYDIAIAIDPHNPSVVYAGGSAPGSGANGQGNTIIATSNASSAGSSGFSINAGSTWTDVANNSCNNCFSGVHVDTHAFAFAPPGSSSGSATKLYAGTDGGAYSAANPESISSSLSWSDLNQTLALTQFYPGMSNNPAGWEYRSFGGTQDNGAQVFGQGTTPGNPLAWDDTLACGDGGATLVDPEVPSTVYSECAYIQGFLLGIAKSVLNGSADDIGGSTTFFSASNGINGNDDGNFIPPMAIDPETPQNLYFGTYRVWQTTDGANTWSAISPDVTGAASSNTSTSAYCQQYSSACVLTAVAVSPTDSNEVVTGSSVGFVYLSTNAEGSSASWTDVTSAPLPPRSVTQVAVDPTSANTIYATFSGFSGFNGDNAGHVFAGTVTPGTTPTVAWTDVSTDASCSTAGTYPGPLPNIPVNDIIVDPNQAGQLFVATDIGVFMGELQGTAPTYTGACWQPLGTGLPNSAVLSLSLNNASRTLIAGTHGRSAWAVALGDQQPFHLESLSPASADAGATSALALNLVGQGFTGSSTVNWLVNGSTPSGCTIGTPIESSTTTLTGETATQLAVSVPTACLASGGVADVSVSDPTQTPNQTNALAFTITSNTPTVTEISPTTGSTGSSVSLTLTGTNFTSGSTVGLTQLIPAPCSPITPGTQTSTQLTATVPGSCLQYGGIFFVTANNPQPGGGSSNPNLIAAPSPYGVACTNMTTPGCLISISGSAPANDSMSNATAISSNTYSANEDTSGATTSSSDPALPSSCTSSAADNGDAKSVWFKYTPTSNVTAQIDTIGSSYDTILSAWKSTSTANVPPLPATPFAQPPIYLILAFGLAVFLLAFAFRRRRPFSRRFATAMALALLAGSLAFEGACGGGGGTTPTPPPSSGSLTNVACNDDIVSGINRVSQLSNLPLDANTTYYFMVSDWGVAIQDGSGNLTNVLGSGGKLVLNLNAQ